MKDICIVTYVFGRAYQSFIPYYIYFFNVEYPNYDICIYTDIEFDQKYRKQLDELECHNYSIRRFNYKNVGFSEAALRNYEISRAVRWFLVNDEFLQYNSVYIGDIDILIAHEDMGLYEQHITHCDYLGLPYSNCIRLYRENNSIRHIGGNLLRYGIWETIKTARFPIREWKRLTGLHFMKTRECFPALKEQIPLLVQELNNVVEGESYFWTKASINDESVLFELIYRSGLGIPDYDSNDLNKRFLFENDNPKSKVFRPEHGLHLGDWRMSPHEEVVLSNRYFEYYMDFYKKYTNNATLQRLIWEDDEAASELIRKMMNYYDGRIQLYEGYNANK